MPSSIEYTYSSIRRRHVVRTAGFTLAGRGIIEEHSQAEGKPFNVYTLTRTAFERVSAAHPQMTPY